MSKHDDLIRQFEAAGIAVEIQADPRHWKLKHGGVVMGYWPNTGTCYAFGKSFRPSTESLVTAITSGRIRMPESAGEAKCRGCKAKIWWVVTNNKKKMPMDACGEPHWLNCPDADKFRKAS